MKHRLAICFRSLICLSLFFLPSVDMFASHLVGADLSYTWITGNTYKITLAAYGDCGPASAAAFSTLSTSSPQICLYNGGTYIATISLAIQAPSAGTEVTPALCPGVLSQCVNTSSSTPGIKLFIYSANYTLPGTSTEWRFVFNGSMVASSAGRAAAITNLTTAGSTTIQLIDTLNNSVSHNTNPVLNVVPLPYYAINMPHTYNPGAIDADGDSLVYSLVAGDNATSACTSVGGPVTYTSGTSAAMPLLTASGAFAFAPNTGQLVFYPNVLQRALVVYHIREFRAGVLIGTIQREMTILVTPDLNNLPAGGFTAPVACSLPDTVTLSACDTAGAFQAEIHPVDADAADTIFVTPLGIPAGASFVTVGNGTPNPVSTFSWNTSSAVPGIYTFFVKYNDNACPMSGSQTIAYTVKVVDCSLTTPTSAPVAELGAIGGLKVFPNPSDGAFNIEAGTAPTHATVTVVDIYGRVVWHTQWAENQRVMHINADVLAPGIYSIRVVTGTGIFTEKVIVRK